MISIRYGLIDPEDIKELDRYEKPKPRVHDHLITSVRQHGFVNPIIVWATKGTIRVHYGISRVHVARELGLSLPAVICDFDDRFTEYERLRTIDEIASKWYNPEIIKPHLNLSTKLWMTHHPRVAINDRGDWH